MRKIFEPGRLAACAGALAAVMSALPANAYEIADGESFHADSFGNLVIYSPAGYKRIVVGQGHAAAAFEAQRARDPQVIYGDDEREYRTSRRCRIEPGVFHGRSYMYGLPDGVVPSPARRVCD
ncbi:MAG: hypothetical protein WBA44_15685 [Mesorhizobium sp.]